MHKLPDLSYDYGALEPHIDAQTMEIHHSRHHQGYVNKLNTALDGTGELAEKPVEALLQDLNSIPENIRTAVQNSGGGHANHSLFWTVMSPEGGGDPNGVLAEALIADFKSIGDFRAEFTEAASTVFGSGWAWLVVTPGGGLEIQQTQNQNSPLSSGNTPILGLDVWEHAYYLKYQNKRSEYIEAWWNVVHWPTVATHLEAAKRALV